MSGAPVNVLPNAGPAGVSDDVTVVVQQHPIPTAQIAIFLFEDNYPLNGTPDLPEEENPPAGGVGADGLGPVDWTQFNIILEDPAGLYGQQGGPVLQDAFGNQLGTTYLPTAIRTRSLCRHPRATASCARTRTATCWSRTSPPASTASS